MICPICGHRTRIATASWTRCGLPAVTAGSSPTSLTPGWSVRFHPGRSGSWPSSPPTCRAPAARDVLVVRQHGGKYVKEGRWLVPARIALRTRECRVTLDFTDAVITSRALRIDADMVHGKLFIVSSPGIVINTDGLTCTYSKLKLHSTNEAADSRLRVEFACRLLHAKIIEQRPRR
jgi:hypothetical protein